MGEQTGEGWEGAAVAEIGVTTPSGHSDKVYNATQTLKMRGLTESEKLYYRQGR